LTGVGLGQFGRFSGGIAGYAHNEWADFAAATGFPGLLLVLGVYYSVWRRLSRVIAQRRGEAEMYQARMARVTLIILVISGAVFRPNLISLDTMFLLALVAGAGNWSLAKR
jgi:O-antigen ligase